MDNTEKKMDAENTLELEFTTPLTARSSQQMKDAEPLALDDDIPTIEAVTAERQRLIEKGELDDEQVEGGSAVLDGAGKGLRTVKTAAQIPVQSPESRIMADPPSFGLAKSPPARPFQIIIPNRDRLLTMPENISTGAFLRQAREAAALTIEQVEEVTKISKHFLISLEADDMSKMPPPVYVIAYIRKLCDFYNIDNESLERMAGELRTLLDREVPDTVINRVEFDQELAESNQREIKRLFWILFGSAGAVVLVLICVGIWFFAGDTAQSIDPPGGASVMPGSAILTDEALLQLLPPPQLQLNELPARN